MPPLTYFACGSVSIPAFFQHIADRASCGLVLDIGHLWTVYRYTGAWRRRSVEQFLAEFLDDFPLERVIEIHVAGLAPHPAEAGDCASARGSPFLPRSMLTTIRSRTYYSTCWIRCSATRGWRH
jgi:hypothetical protein